MMHMLCSFYCNLVAVRSGC